MLGPLSDIHIPKALWKSHRCKMKVDAKVYCAFSSSKESVLLAKSFLDAHCTNMERVPVQILKCIMRSGQFHYQGKNPESVSLIDYRVGGEGSHSANGTGGLVYLFIKTITKRLSFY